MAFAWTAPQLQVDFGIVFFDFELDRPFPERTTFYDGPRPMWYIEGPEPSPVLSFKVAAQTYNHRAIIRDVLRYRPNSVVGLGPGLVCCHCGSKNPSGVLRCVFCGGGVEEGDWLEPFSLMGKAAGGTEWSRPAMIAYSDDEMLPWEGWSISLDPGIDLDMLVRSLGGPAHILPVGNVLEEGFYLCHHCGRATPIGETCAGCGGEQIPLSEVIRIDRRCLSCGTKTTAGVLCPKCGRAFSSESYKQWARL